MTATVPAGLTWFAEQIVRGEEPDTMGPLPGNWFITKAESVHDAAAGVFAVAIHLVKSDKLIVPLREKLE